MQRCNILYLATAAFFLVSPGEPATAEQSAIDLPELCRSAAKGHASAKPGMEQGVKMPQGMIKGETAADSPKDVPGGDTSGTQQGLHRAMMAMNKPMMMGMMANEADVAWICAMIPHHQGAIDMARAGLKEADNSESRKMAEETIAAQEKAIAKLTAWVEKYAKEESSKSRENPETTPE